MELRKILENIDSCYVILQLHKSSTTALELFSSMQELQRMGIKPNINHYEIVLVGSLESKRFSFEHADVTLDYISELIFQGGNECAANIKITVSNVIVIKENEKIYCFYVDSVGFQYMPDFITSE